MDYLGVCCFGDCGDFVVVGGDYYEVDVVGG